MSVIEELHLNDVGTSIRITVNDCDANGNQSPLDVSTASTLEISFKKPCGDSETKTASLVTDGTDGQIEYITTSGDLDETGPWKLQVRVVNVNGDWRSNVGSFTVYENI